MIAQNTPIYVAEFDSTNGKSFHPFNCIWDQLKLGNNKQQYVYYTF